MLNRGKQHWWKASGAGLDGNCGRSYWWIGHWNSYQSKVSHVDHHRALERPLPRTAADAGVCDTEAMQSPLQSPTAATDPKSVKVNLSTGTGVDIAWETATFPTTISFICATPALAPCATKSATKLEESPASPPNWLPACCPCLRPPPSRFPPKASASTPSGSSGTTTTTWAFTRGSSCVRSALRGVQGRARPKTG